MRGYSIIELVVVISLLGVLAVAAVVMTTSVDDSRLNVAANQVLSDIYFAQQNATTTGQTSGVDFVGSGSYTVYQGTTATPLLSPLTGQNLVVLLADNYPNVTISANYVVEFDSMGAPTTGGGGQRYHF